MWVGVTSASLQAAAVIFQRVGAHSGLWTYNFHVLDNEQDAMLILVIIESTMTGLRRRRGSGLRGPSRQHSQSCIHLLSDIA